MQFNIFYYVKLNGKKTTTVHIVKKVFSRSLPSSNDAALCGHKDTKWTYADDPYDEGWKYISNQLPTDRKVKVCKSCLRIMNKHLNEMF